MPKRTNATWRAATPEEADQWLSGEASYNDAGGLLELRETDHGLEAWDGDMPLDCGCIPHNTHTHPVWGFYCDTEEQPYCNFECPHDDDDDDDA